MMIPVASWALLELKIMYYHPELVHESWHAVLQVRDSIYDAIESEYKELAGIEDLPVGVDIERPAARVILGTIGKERGPNDKTQLERLLEMRPDFNNVPKLSYE